MIEDMHCQCGQRLRLPSILQVPEVHCHRCGAIVATRPVMPTMIYADQLDAKRGLVSASQVTVAVYERAASRWQHRPRKGIKFRPLLVGLGLFAIAALVHICQIDDGFLHLATVTLAGFGLVACLKGLLGYELFR